MLLFVVVVWVWVKVVGTQLYPLFPLHRPEETPMRSRPTVYGAWYSVTYEEDQINTLICSPEHLFDKSHCRLPAEQRHLGMIP